MEENKRDRLLEAATTVFASKGYHQTTVRDITDYAGVAVGTFYLYFPSKAACFMALLDRLYSTVVQSVAEARRGREGPREKLAASIRAGLEAFVAQRDLARIALIQAAGADTSFDRRLAEIHSSMASLVKEDLDEALQAGLIPPQDTRITSRALVGATYEVVHSWLRGGDVGDLLAAADDVVAFSLRGVGLTEGL